MEKYNQLQEHLTQFDNLAIAFSGGVDSSFLVYVAHQILGEKMVAITMRTPYISEREVQEAIEFTAAYGIPHKVLDITIPDAVKTNPENRCYLCKREVFTTLIAYGTKLGFSHFADGTNLDDLGEYRPGLKALAELGVLSPLTVLHKADIRRYSAEFGLPTAHKPSYACLLTRLPHDYAFTKNDLHIIEWAENLLIHHGFDNVRTRFDGMNLRIELPYHLMTQFVTDAAFPTIMSTLDERIGGQISLDLRGLRNDVLRKD